MTTMQFKNEINDRIHGLKSLSLVLEGLFTNDCSVKINGEIFDGISMFSMQGRICGELLDLHNKLQQNIEKGVL